MPDVFISHSSRDANLALWLKERFHTLGQVEAFQAPFDMNIGDWEPQVWNALRASKFVVLMATANALQSLPVHDEVTIARYDGKEIIVILDGLSPGQLPEKLRAKQAFQLRDPDEMQRVIAEVSIRVGLSKLVGLGIIAALLALAVHSG